VAITNPIYFQHLGDLDAVLLAAKREGDKGNDLSANSHCVF
jgi:hypothetical protein